VNAMGGKYGNALQAASFIDDEVILRNCQWREDSGGYHIALQLEAVVTAHQHNAVIVKLLLENGAAVNAEGGIFCNALQAASFRGAEAIVNLLLENGADVNLKGGKYENALQASCEGYDAILKLLLDNGAKGGEYWDELQVGLFAFHEIIIKLLLNNGAEVNSALVKGNLNPALKNLLIDVKQ
jgi:hypothetical protein